MGWAIRIAWMSRSIGSTSMGGTIGVAGVSRAIGC